MNGQKTATTLDEQVGARARLRRQVLGMSQSALAEAIGVTFQQVQKYERGTNRIAASRLQQIADALGVDVGYFYQTAAGDASSGDKAAAGLLTAQSLRLAQTFQTITDPQVRRHVAQLVETLAKAGAGEPSAEASTDAAER